MKSLSDLKPKAQREALERICNYFDKHIRDATDDEVEIILEYLELGFFENITDQFGDFFGTEGWRSSVLGD